MKLILLAMITAFSIPSLPPADFESGSSGLPEGWSSVGRDTEGPRVLEDAEGERFIRAWYQAGARARLDGLKDGEPFPLRFQTRRSPRRERNLQ